MTNLLYYACYFLRAIFVILFSSTDVRLYHIRFALIYLAVYVIQTNLLRPSKFDIREVSRILLNFKNVIEIVCSYCLKRVLYYVHNKL
jgi:hypothetical protein